MMGNGDVGQTRGVNHDQGERKRGPRHDNVSWAVGKFFYIFLNSFY